MLGELGLGFIESQKTRRLQQFRRTDMQDIQRAADRADLGMIADPMRLWEPLMRPQLTFRENAFEQALFELLASDLMLSSTHPPVL